MLKLVAVVALVSGAVQNVAGQAHPASEPGRILIVEVDFGADTARVPTVDLRKGVLYWAEVVGSGIPVLEPLRGARRRAFIVPMEQGTESQRFQVSPLQSGPHSLLLEDRVPGSPVIVRLFEDVIGTERLRAKHERAFAIGVSLAVGLHTGLGIDSLGGADPRGGSGLEACLLLQSTGRFGTCLGGGRESFPDAGLNVGWLFLEERARLLYGQIFGGRATDLSAAIRVSKATGVGSRNVYPALVSFGVQATQHLATDGRRRGTSLLLGWQHGTLINAPHSKDRNADRVTVGVIWLP